MSIKEKIESLGLTLPVAALPVAAYVPAVRTGNLVFVAGQLPLVDGKIVKEGKVGKEVTPEEAKEMTIIFHKKRETEDNLKNYRYGCFLSDLTGLA